MWSARWLKAGRFIQSDATGLPILHGSKKKPTRGHFWSYTNGTQVVMKVTLDATGLPILRTF